MEFRILGPVELADGDRLVVVGGPRQRALLAILLLHANELVPADQLVEELWEARPPAACRSLQVYVSRLRKALGSASGRLANRSGGYMLRLEPDELDSQRFERLLSDGRRALSAGDHERASKILREALALWRGQALMDFRYAPFAQVEIARLEELRLAALEERIEADLALEFHRELIAELESLVRAYPLRERTRGQLMLALYRSDRQAEALHAYRQGRRYFREQLGLAPSPSLQRLEEAILAQSAELDLLPDDGDASPEALPVPAR